MARHPAYWVGGSLDGDNAFYVERAADQELFARLMLGETCFVFNSRQMGKSSLRVRTMQRLRQQGVVCAVIDPQSRGTTPTEEQWYAGTLKRLSEDLGLAEALPFSTWWKDVSVQVLSPVNRFEEFIDKILLPRLQVPVVIFVEEVDNLLSLQFDTDGFFGLIRSLVERRNEHPAYQRLSFCFLGVATPYDLIREDHRSAFNIGHAVDLSGLGRHEAEPLLVGLAGKVADPAAVLDAVLHWSGGQPFLTQKLLALVSAANQPDRSAAELVAAVADDQIIHNWESQDLPVHLRTIRDRLLLGEERHRGRLLGLLQTIQERGGIPADSSREQMQLRLTGLVVPKDGELQLYNPIYAGVFTPEWVRGQLQELRPPIYAEAIGAWEKASAKARPSHLIGGAALRQALAWAKGKSLSPADQEFLEASREAQDTANRAAEATRLAEERARVAERDKQLAERDASHRRRWVVGLGVGVVLLGGLSVFALIQRRDAIRNGLAARMHEQAALALNEMTATPVEALIRALALTAQTKGLSFGVEANLGDDVLTQVLAHDIVWAEADRILGHTGPLTAAVFSRDGRRLVSASSDTTLRFWDRDSGQPIGPPLQGHTGAVNALAISPDGRILVSGSSDTTLRRWDAATGRPLGSPLRGHRASLSSVAISPDGRLLVSGSFDNTLRLWDTATGRPFGSPLRGHTGRVRSVAFHPDGRRILSGSDDSTLRLWDVATGRPLGSPLRGHSDRVFAVAFSPDGTRIASGSVDRSLRLWDATSGRPLGQPLLGHTSYLTGVAFSPDGQSLISSSADRTLRLWDGKTGKPLGNPILGHGSFISAVAFSPDGRSLLSASGDESLRLWQRFSTEASGRRLAGGKGVASLALNARAGRVVAGFQDRSLWLWDAVTGQALGKPLLGHGDWVNAVAFSPDGRLIVSGSGDTTLRLWDAERRKPIGSPLRGHDDYVLTVAFSPDGRRIVSGSADTTLRLWDPRTGRPLHPPLRGHHDSVNAAAFSPDGRRLVSGSDDNSLRLWDVTTGQPLGPPLLGHRGAVRAVAFSPDGRWIASGSDDRSLRLWNATTGKPFGPPLEGHTGSVIALLFSADGKQIISGSLDNSVRRWQVSSGQPLAVALHNDLHLLRALVFGPEGSRIVSANENDVLRFWDVNPMAALQLACQRLRRHQLLWNPAAYSGSDRFLAIAKRAQTMCAPPARMAGPVNRPLLPVETRRSGSF